MIKKFMQNFVKVLIDGIVIAMLGLGIYVMINISTFTGWSCIGAFMGAICIFVMTIVYVYFHDMIWNTFNLSELKLKKNNKGAHSK